MELCLKTLTLTTFNKDNLEELIFLKKLCKDNTIKKRFQGIAVGLLNNPNNEFFDHGFFVKHNNTLIGYIGIGAYNKYEKCVYLRAAINKEQRGLSYGTTLLSEITDYIFKTYSEVLSIRLKINDNNKPSIKVAISNGYKNLYNDFYIKYNPYLINSENKALKKYI